jgi:cysteine synthase A
MKAASILQTIGNTPHVRINRLFPSRVEVYMKLERANPGGSIKDRIGLSMIEDAEQHGILKKDSVIIEPTSGNTGIGLAMVAAVKGYKLILVMPESMSLERRRLMAAYGAQLELTPRAGGMKGAIARAQEMVAQTPNAWMPQQFENEANIEVHRRTTATSPFRRASPASPVIRFFTRSTASLPKRRSSAPKVPWKFTPLSRASCTTEVGAWRMR